MEIFQYAKKHTLPQLREQQCDDLGKSFFGKNSVASRIFKFKFKKLSNC